MSVPESWDLSMEMMMTRMKMGALIGATAACLAISANAAAATTAGDDGAGADNATGSIDAAAGMAATG